MLAKYGRTQLGKRSQHSLQATGPRTYQVVELDIKATHKNGQPTIWAPLIEKWTAAGISVADACSAILWRLNALAPLTLVVHSGNISLHGWFRAIPGEESAWKEVMRFAVELGADKATWTRNQFVRMPGGLREKPDGPRSPGVRQQVFYFNPQNAVNETAAPKEVFSSF